MTVCLRARLLAEAQFRHGFSLRSGGVSEAPFDSLNLARNVGDDPARVEENLRRFADTVGFHARALFEVSQVHGAEVIEVGAADEPARLRQREADALVTSREGAAVGVRVADCVPILLACPRSRAVAAVHAGWRGVVAGVVERAVSALLARAQSEPGTLLAAVGPHIGAAAFEVGPEVAEAIAASVPPGSQVVLPRTPRPHVDLGRAVRAQLLRAGLADAHVESVPGCTYAEPARFFSFRRDGRGSGRLLAAIVAGC